MIDNSWHRIGVDGRRSLWVRFIMAVDSIEWTAETIAAIECRAGREGDDAEIRIDKTNPQFEPMLELFLTAEYAAEISSAEHPEWIDRAAHRLGEGPFTGTPAEWDDWAAAIINEERRNG